MPLRPTTEDKAHYKAIQAAYNHFADRLADMEDEYEARPTDWRLSEAGSKASDSLTKLDATIDHIGFIAEELETIFNYDRDTKL